MGCANSRRVGGVGAGVWAVVLVLRAGQDCDRREDKVSM
jgi:hypothetical protein